MTTSLRRSRKRRTTEMSSAAEKVFGIPELLEQVLLCLSWRQLFVLTRINQTFRDTISDSVSLRRRKHLDYEKPRDEKDVDYSGSPDNDISADLEHDYLSFGPFDRVDRLYGEKQPPYLKDFAGLIQRPGQRQRPSSDGPITCEFSLELPVWEPDKTTPMGLVVHGKWMVRRLYNGGSWCRMKLTRYPTPFRVEIRVGQDPQGIMYTDALDLAVGEGNLGMVSPRWIGLGTGVTRSTGVANCALER